MPEEKPISLFETEVVPNLSWEEFLALKQTDWQSVVGYDKPEDNANNRSIFAQSSAPIAGYKEGDLWIDTDDGNKIYRSNNALTWVLLTTFSTKINSIFETTGRFSNNVVGSGAVAFNTYGLVLNTGATNPSGARVLLYGASNMATGSPTFSCLLNAVTTSATQGNHYFGIGDVGIETDDFTLDHIGFKIVNRTLSATQANGTETSSVLTTITDGNNLDLIFKVNGTSSVDYWYRKDNGTFSAKTTLTTNIPTATITSLAFGCNNTASTADLTIRIFGFSYER